jgi:hypothetical protein
VEHPPARQLDDTPSPETGSQRESGVPLLSLLLDAKSPEHPTTTWFQLMPKSSAPNAFLR